VYQGTFSCFPVFLRVLRAQDKSEDSPEFSPKSKNLIITTNVHQNIMSEEGEDTAPLSVWIGLSLIALISFWCQATVTEER
jgi:hypothetical protein